MPDAGGRRHRSGGRVRPALSSARVAAASWTVVDQFLSALSNLAISLAVGRGGGSQLLGAFTVAFTVYLLCLGFQRSLVTEPLMSQASTGQAGNRAAADAAVLRCCAAYAVAAALLVAVAGAVLSSSALLALAVVLPALLLQDGLRYIALRNRAPRRAAALDGTWLAVVLLSFPFVVRSHSVVLALLLWGAGALAACLYGIVTHPLPGSASAALQWWRSEAQRLGGLLAIDSVVQALAVQGVTLALAVVLGLDQLGELRAALLLLGPVTTGLLAFNAFVLPRLADRAGTFTRRQAGVLCSLTGGLTTAVVGVTVLLGPLIGRLAFGPKIDVRLPTIATLGLALVVMAFTAGLGQHLKVLRRVGEWTALRLVAAAASVPVVLVLAEHHGLSGAVFGLLLQAVLGALADVLAWTRATGRKALGAAPGSTPVKTP